MKLNDTLDKALRTGDLTREEIVFLLSLEGEDEKALFRVADQVRKENVGDEVHIRGLIEFSNYCARECLYCGLRADNADIHRYRMPIEEIIETAVGVVEKGIGTIVLQSGEDPWFTAERMTEIIRGIKS
ncbi:MAG TPA: [FeFe] hydrogenase H-cluster radical SAM maturase HydE, partial [Armatimonadota bacterium]